MGAFGTLSYLVCLYSVKFENIWNWINLKIYHYSVSKYSINKNDLSVSWKYSKYSDTNSNVKTEGKIKFIAVTIDIERPKIDCLSFVMCPLLAQLKIVFFSSFVAAAVYSTNEANKAGLKQSIFLDVYGSYPLKSNKKCSIFVRKIFKKS
jgi:hypothetical protein